jgi:hypothetical protein
MDTARVVHQGSEDPPVALGSENSLACSASSIPRIFLPRLVHQDEHLSLSRLELDAQSCDLEALWLDMIDQQPNIC